MIVYAYDTETGLIRPGRAAPELACVSFATNSGFSGLLHHADPLAHDFLRDIYAVAAEGTGLVVGHNLAFDSAVTVANFPDLQEVVFAAYEAGGCTDTMLRQQLLDIAAGCFRGRHNSDGSFTRYDYDLASLVRRAHFRDLPDLSKDEWRLSYGQLRDLPLDQWPQGALDYAQLDAVATLRVFEAQGGADLRLPTERDEARAFFALQLSSVWGLRTDPVKVAQFEADTRARLEEVRGGLQAVGLVRADGSRDTKAAQAMMARAWEESGGRPRRTAPTQRFPEGQLCLDEDACEACGDPVMQDYAELSTLTKMLGNDARLLQSASHLPVHPGYKLLETCRMAARKQAGLTGGNMGNISRGNWRRCPNCRGEGTQAGDDTRVERT